MQVRYAPNRADPLGAWPPLPEIVKFATKPDSRPRTAIPLLYTLAPAISIITAVAAFAIIPFGDTVDIFGSQVGLYGIDVDRKSTRLNSSHANISYAVFCLKKKN